MHFLNTLLYLFSSIFFTIYEHKTLAEQPQPEPPECTSCVSASNIRFPQSLCIVRISTPLSSKSLYRSSEPIFPRSPVKIASKSVGCRDTSFKKEYIVSAAAGAMAAPILFASLIAKSIILPTVTYLIFISPPKPTIAAPEPVTVHCEVSGLTPPYSSGNLYRFQS